ncbi:hypothetical protein PSA7680_00314 [Pseudoruegeria aquimaris]|uniref:Uncharacterized protein n=1 Tax=Pseudoruegeria aquimaris TaxID=393663 RepID=A0A1Y5RGH3_9RHOB|nr:hypothetical protein [Pseudoruegeria aquimaris]SLN14319.1 hypothetical protein PSA7680_00314 [Pseudoruegeria aquimaris]
MKEPQKSVFVARETYRQRRTMDAARLLPLFGILALLLPLFWSETVTAERGTSRGIVYLFSVWIVLILCAAYLSRRLRSVLRKDESDGDAGGGG